MASPTTTDDSVPEYGGHQPSRREGARRAVIADIAQTISTAEQALGIDGSELPAHVGWDGERVDLQGAPPGMGPLPLSREAVEAMMAAEGMDLGPDVIPLTMRMPDGGCIMLLTTPQDRHAAGASVGGTALPASETEQQQEEGKEEEATATTTAAPPAAPGRTAAEPEASKEEEGGGEDPAPASPKPPTTDASGPASPFPDGPGYIWPEDQDGYHEPGATRICMVFPDIKVAMLTEQSFKKLLGVDAALPPPLFVGWDAFPPTFCLPGMDLQMTRLVLDMACFAWQSPVIQWNGPPGVATGYRTATGGLVVHMGDAARPAGGTTTTTKEEEGGSTDYAAMSVRELKRVLAARGVSCAGIVEKAELEAACRESSGAC